MEKKRRDFINCELINLTKAKEGFVEAIATRCVSKNNFDGFSVYEVKKAYGKGRISLLKYNGVEVQLSHIELKRDLVLYDEINEDVLEMSFLIDGEKIISLRGVTDVLNESQEAYTARVKEFKGYLRITGDRPFRELKVRLSTSYLKMHGFENLEVFKSFNDKHIIHSISNDVLAVLMSLQQTAMKGLPKRIFTEAKVLELLALQLIVYEKGKVQINGSSQDKILKKLYAAKQLMVDNLDQNLSIRELSRELAINEYIFKKEFKRIFGCSINEYYALEKMNKAKELLKGTQLPIYEIAGEIGYKNATHFSAAFKRFYGKTPKKYRSTI